MRSVDQEWLGTIRIPIASPQPPRGRKRFELHTSLPKPLSGFLPYSSFARMKLFAGRPRSGYFSCRGLSGSLSRTLSGLRLL
jgi:hypothetical protein